MSLPKGAPFASATLPVVYDISKGAILAAKFLSEEWMTGLEETVNAHAGFKDAISSVSLKLQFKVTDVDGGEVDYAIVIGDGSASIVNGTIEDADATITNNHETAAAISKGELNTQMAFMTGKLKVSGNMAALMMNQGALNQFAQAASGLDVEY